MIDRGPPASLLIQDTSAFILNLGSPQFQESGGRKPVISLGQTKTFDSPVEGGGGVGSLSAKVTG